ncbi:hypothetical protein ACTM9N_04640 [Lachnospiraceae bacterium HCP1S3_A8]
MSKSEIVIGINPCTYSRMPDVNEAASIHKKLFESVRSLAPLADFESFDVLCNKRAETYE